MDCEESVTASHLAFREDVVTFWLIEAAAAGRMTGSQESSILLELDETMYSTKESEPDRTYLDWICQAEVKLI